MIFLHVNATSFCQPLDQGKIRSWKAHYHRRWVQYMVNKYAETHDPNKTMHVLQALRWEILAWNRDVTPTTNAICWLQAQVLGPKYCPRTEAQAKEREKAQYAEIISQI